jgi:hypothetical protein
VQDVPFSLIKVFWRQLPRQGHRTLKQEVNSLGITIRSEKNSLRITFPKSFTPAKHHTLASSSILAMTIRASDVMTKDL